MNIEANGRKYTGTPRQIVQEMKSMDFGGGSGVTLPEYVRKLAQRMEMMGGKATVDDGPEDEMCESLVRQLIEQGFANKA